MLYMTTRKARQKIGEYVAHLGSQQAVADELGCSKSTICLFIHTDRTPSFPLMQKMADDAFLRIPIESWYPVKRTKAA